MVAGATAAHSSPLHHHSHRRLRPRHTVVCWRDPHPLPLTDRLTGRWSSRTPTPIQWVVGDDHVPSMVGIAPPGWHRSTSPHHRAVRGRRRRRRWWVSHHGGHRSHWGADDTLGDAHLHQSMGPTPRTTGTSDRHHTTNLTDSFTHHAGTTVETYFQQAGCSDSGTPPDLKSPCGNWLLCWFAHLAAPSGRGRALGLRDSTAKPRRWAAKEEGERHRGTRVSG
jgi:hypothetical protein